LRYGIDAVPPRVERFFSVEKSPMGYSVFDLRKRNLKSKREPVAAPVWNEDKKLIGAEFATSDADNSDNTGAEERKRSWLRNRWRRSS
jgi:hypothetical protein